MPLTLHGLPGHACEGRNVETGRGFDISGIRHSSISASRMAADGRPPIPASTPLWDNALLETN